MKQSLLKYIVCPICGSDFKIVSTVPEGEEIVTAALTCVKDRRHMFPVTKGVPRLLVESDNAQKQVQDSFSEKWNRVPNYGFETRTKDFQLNWYLERYGWGNIENLAGFLQDKKFILDAGTGLGRDTALYARHTKGEVFGVDISESIDIAYQHIGHLPNVHLIQADLTQLPFGWGLFDFIASDQVLHHTPNTGGSFRYLLSHLKIGGDIAIYVYKKKGPIREFCDDYIRSFTTKLSPDECYGFCQAATKFGRSLSDMKAEVVVPEDIPYLDIKAGKQDLQRFLYWNVFKCFWNDDFDFETNVIVNFDWYHPTYAWRYTPEEVYSWFRDMDLKILHTDVCDSGISVRGRK